MKRFVTVVLMAILLAACEGRKEMADGLERIPVNVEDVAEDYVLMSDMNVFTFTGDGKSIGSSVKKRGPGPDEYTLPMDIKFNHFLDGIDLLTPYGTIYTYSPTFELLARRTFKPEFVLAYMMPLDSFRYVFQYASLWVDQEIGFADLRTGDISIANYDGMISSGNGLYHPHFHKIGDDF